LSEGKHYVTFFKATFRETKGYLSLFVENTITTKKFNKYFRYPEDLEKVPEFIIANEKFGNIWFCAQLLDRPDRRKENISKCITVWADLDDCPPQQLLVEPTILIESSPSRWQALWVLESEIDSRKAEEYARRIAYHHKDLGADTSGWDLTQLLRVPFTRNFKYDERPIVRIEKVKTSTIALMELDKYPRLAMDIKLETPMPDISQYDTDAIVAGTNNAYIIGLYSTIPRSDWSKSLWNLEKALFNKGFSREEVFAIAQKAACNKYLRDDRPPVHLWHEILRAESSEEDVDIEVNVWDISILTDKERLEIESSPGIVEEYIKWANSVTDAPVAFHEGCAFMVLSSLLCGSIYLKVGFGKIYTNLWLILLAESTFARKTTAMNMAVNLIEEIDSDIVLANEGSIEGILSTMVDRPKRASLFHRDEITGFIETVVRKDYLSGMLEWITKLYDGDRVKRVLKKEKIVVNNPRFLFLGGGILSRIDELLTTQHVTSGFIPRFLIIRSKVDLTNYRPLFEPLHQDIDTDTLRDQLKRKLQLIHGYYERTTTMSIDDDSPTVIDRKEFPARVTEEAQLLYSKYEVRFVQASQQTEQVGVYSPLFQRLCTSGLKMAILLAASRTEDELLVTTKDIKHAFYYIQKWAKYSIEMVENIGKTTTERTISDCLNFIQKYPEGVHRSTLYRRFHLQDLTGRMVIETLKQRGLIIVNGAKLLPNTTVEKVTYKTL